MNKKTVEFLTKTICGFCYYYIQFQEIQNKKKWLKGKAIEMATHAWLPWTSQTLPLDCLSSGSGPAATIFNIYNYFIELLCIWIMHRHYYHNNEFIWYAHSFITYLRLLFSIKTIGIILFSALIILVVLCRDILKKI